MAHDNTSAQKRAWQESGHASLCLLGSYLQEQRFFQPLETRVHLRQKALKYTPVQKLEMLLISLLAGAKAVSHSNFTLRADPALYRAFGLPGCAEQSVIADTLDGMTEADLGALREAIGDLFAQYSQAADTTSIKPSWCSMWTCRPCRPVGWQKARSGLTWDTLA